MLVQICFTIDCTSSMGPWIHAVKTQTEDMIRPLRHDFQDACFEVGVVCYRDYDDKERFKIIEFTPNITKVVHEIHNLQAEGGNDDAEDVAGGLIYTQMLPWDPDATVKMVFHIADAPAHGTRYHTSDVSDRFIWGDPQGINPEEVLTELSKQKIDYTFIKITTETDIMLRHFEKAYEGLGKFEVIKLQSFRQLSNTVIRSVTQNISSQDPKEDLCSPTLTTGSQNQESSTSP